MKKKLLGAPVLVAVICVTLFMSSAVPAFCGGSLFGVRPGSLVQSAYFGFGSGSMVGLVGLDFLKASVTVEDSDISASAYVPNFGLRFYLNPGLVSGAVVPYLQGTFMKSFASIDIGDSESELTDAIGDLLSFYGFSIAFGAEYFFSDRFSVGGEYGLRYIMTSTEMDVAIDILDEPIEVDSDLDVSYGASYAAVCLNFHFR